MNNLYKIGQSVVPGVITPGPLATVEELVRNAVLAQGVRGMDENAVQRRGKIARVVASVYAREISTNPHFWSLPLVELHNASIVAAADSDTLGTLAGTLVLQKALEFFRIQYPMFSAIYTDFSDQPGKKGQAIDTRVVGKPAVQTYDNTQDTDGRPKGWGTASPATTTSKTITLDEHIGVPIVFGSDSLSGTVRNLFEEQSPAVAYALASYFVQKTYAKFTPANYNAYAVVNGGKVPVAYTTYAKGLGDFSRSAVVDLNAIFNPNEVPMQDRCLLLNSVYYGAMGKDPAIAGFYAAVRDPEIITEGQLPKLSRFVPVECPDFPSSQNRVGIALQKNGVGAISRIPVDYSLALPGAGSGNGSVTTVADITGMAMMLVQYVNHRGGWAEMRGEALIGADVMDNRGGLVLTSQ